MAEGAVCRELVSAMDSLVSGNFAGDYADGATRTPTDSFEYLRILLRTECFEQGIVFGITGNLALQWTYVFGKVRRLRRSRHLNT
jgi:hypothetical protein